MDKDRKNLKAVAIKYDKESVAPNVVSKGRGIIAEKIIEKAKDNDVKIYEDKKLVEELLNIDVGAHIPEELYEVVAKVLIFISDLDKLESYRR